MNILKIAAVALAILVPTIAQAACPRTVNIHNDASGGIRFLYFKCENCDGWSKMWFRGELEPGDEISVEIGDNHRFYVRADIPYSSYVSDAQAMRNHYSLIEYVDACRSTNVSFEE